MEPTIWIVQSTGITASSRYPPTGANAHETSNSSDTRRAPAVRYPRTGKTRGATSNGTSKTVRCRSTTSTFRNGNPTWTWPTRPPTIGPVRRTHANASTLETTYADPGQGNIRFERERRFVHQPIFHEPRDGIEEPSCRWRRRDGLGYRSRHDTEDTPEGAWSRGVEVTSLNHQPRLLLLGRREG